MTDYTKEITKKELQATTRICTDYVANLEMILPQWEEMRLWSNY
ncbi:MAG: hypothetical protein SPH94_06765 [Fusobacterium necrophorum]|nr:hypothetical protein [Fusobacterium necrophorum]